MDVDLSFLFPFFNRTIILYLSGSTPPPLCVSHALVQTTVGVGTVLIWDFGVAYTKGGGYQLHHHAPEYTAGPVLFFPTGTHECAVRALPQRLGGLPENIPATQLGPIVKKKSTPYIRNRTRARTPAQVAGASVCLAPARGTPCRHVPHAPLVTPPPLHAS